jgi:DNA-binding response OmpR family regulator
MTTARVLVVDDEAVIRNFLMRVLEREGYAVSAASNGREALTLLENTTFELLLTDIRMDHLDGVGLLEEARSLYPDLAIILLTGHATVESAVVALRRGASDYLLKPVKNEDLVEAVAAGLEKRSHRRRRDKLEQIANQFVDVVRDERTSHDTGIVEAEVICGPLVLNPASYTAALAGERLNLTPTEFRLLLEFCQEPGIAFDYISLVRDACGYTCTRQEAQEIIGAHVRNLRHKLGISPGEPLYVEAVRSIGYRLIPPES